MKKFDRILMFLVFLRPIIHWKLNDTDTVLELIKFRVKEWIHSETPDISTVISR